MKKISALVLIYFVIWPLLWTETASLLPEHLSGKLCSHQLMAMAITGDEEGSWLDRFKAMFVDQTPTSPNQLVDTITTSIIEDYALLYNIIHGEEQKKYDSIRQLGLVDWDRLQSPDLVLDNFIINIEVRSPEYKVFGWHPYWMGSAYENYNFKILTHVSLFSYDINPASGLPKNPEVVEGFMQSPIIALAQADSCKVLMTITSLKAEDNRKFLENRQGQQFDLINKLIEIIESSGINGIDINFEQIPRGYEIDFFRFVNNLSVQIKKINPDHLISVVLPQVDRNLKVEEMQEFVDFFIFTGYDYTTSRNKKDGPIAPLENRAISNGMNIADNINQYFRKKVEPKKLLLGVPYYGARWSDEVAGEKSPSSRFDRHLTYREIMAQYPMSGEVKRPDSLKGDHSAYASFKAIDGSASFDKIWYDDTVSLKQKYIWTKQQGLGGIGIWALGYDNPRSELWQLLNEEFSYSGGYSLRTNLMEGNKFLIIVNFLRKYRIPLIIAGIFFVMFVTAGFISAIFDWRVRDVFFSNKTLRLLYVIGTAAGLTILYAVFRMTANKDVTSGLSIGQITIMIVAGAILTVIIHYFFEKYRSRLP